MTTIICLIAVLFDRLIGDPKRLPHPVIWIGNLISFLEKILNHGRNKKFKGFITVLITIAIPFIIVTTICYISYKIHFFVGVLVEVILINIALSQKSLKEAAMIVYDALKEKDIVEARKKLGWIVGRDTENLEEKEIVRGVVETVSENTSDGVTAPIFYAILFGAPGIWVYKAINTLDSMIAYKNERYKEFGFFAAKLDDVANFIPSRITGLFILLFTKNESKLPFSKRIKCWIQDAKKHPSPNSGYLEAATAYQLGIRLGGVNYYFGEKSFRSYMGKEMVEMNKQHIIKTIRQMNIVVLYFLLIIGGITFGITITWGKCIHIVP